MIDDLEDVVRTRSGRLVKRCRARTHAGTQCANGASLGDLCLQHYNNPGAEDER